MRGRFITFEGPEGSGKSTQLALLKKWMAAAGLPARTTREPGGTDLGGQIRDLLLSPREEPIEPMAELLLYEADRAQHVAQVIRPALEAGIHVLCDRFTDSTLAYQVYGRELPADKVRELNALASGGLVPDLTFLCHVPPAVGLERARGESAGDRLEGESLAFHEKVSAGFLELAEQEPSRFRRIPDGTIEAAHAHVCRTLSETFGWTGKNSSAKTPR